MTGATSGTGTSHPSVAPDFLWNSCSILYTRHATLVANSLISHERGNEDMIVMTTNGTYLWSSGTQIFRNGQPSKQSLTRKVLNQGFLVINLLVCLFVCLFDGV
jgi:hypothetical protein